MLEVSKFDLEGASAIGGTMIHRLVDLPNGQYVVGGRNCQPLVIGCLSRKGTLLEELQHSTPKCSIVICTH